MPMHVNVDQVLTHHVAGVGLFQIMVAVFSGLSDVPSSLLCVFLFGQPDFRCRSKPEYESQLKNLSFDKAASIIGPSRFDNELQRRNLEKTELGCFTYSVFNDTLSELNECQNGYVYKVPDIYYPNSLIAEWDLVCNNAWKIPFTTTMYMLGMMMGFVLGGQLGGILGRRRLILLMSFTQIFSVMFISWSPNYGVFAMFRFMSAFAFSGIMNGFFVLLNELTLCQYRSMYIAISHVISDLFNRIVMIQSAIHLTHWRVFNAVSMVPASICLLFPCLIPESPRWLLSQHRPKEALLYLYRGYCLNQLLPCFRNKNSDKKKLTTMFFEEKLDADENTLRKNYMMLRNPKLDIVNPVLKQINQSKRNPFADFARKVCHKERVLLLIKCVLIYTFHIMIYYGLMFYTRLFKGSIYFTMTLYAFTALISTALSTVMYRFIKSRKKPILCLYSLVTVILIICATYVKIKKPENDLFLVIGTNIAYLLMMSVHMMLFVYVAELFPSDFRAQGLGMSSGLGRLGATSCGFINQLDVQYFHACPLYVYAAALVLQIILLLTTSDTTGENLKEFTDQQHHTAEENDEIYLSMNELNGH